MTWITVAHTAHVDPKDLGAARALLDDAFPDGFGELDWEHCLGGLHALAWDAGELVGHGALVQRRLFHHGRALRTGYIEGVAVREPSRRSGVGSLLMEELERLVRAAYEVGALSASDVGVPFYHGRGWLRWRGHTGAMGPEGIVATPADDEAVFVLPVHAPLNPAGHLVCDWRDGDVW
jgi:aminoglycoside 2'-N-acetyltransferase I